MTGLQPDTTHRIRIRAYSFQGAGPWTRTAVCRTRSLEVAATNLAPVFRNMLSEWNIEMSRVHVIVRDGAANMVKMVKELDCSDLHCLAHCLNVTPSYDWTPLNFGPART